MQKSNDTASSGNGDDVCSPNERSGTPVHAIVVCLHQNERLCDYKLWRTIETDVARPREFDESVVLDAAMQCFWLRGYDATSVRDLIEATGVTGASLYNAFGDKRALYERALDRYVEASIEARIRRCEALPPREAIGSFFAEILERSLKSSDFRGCMLVNAAMEVAPRDLEFQRSIEAVLSKIERFFLQSVAAGQDDGSIKCRMDAQDLARHLLGILLGIRVLCRVKPDRQSLEGMLAPAFALLDGGA